MGVKLMTGATGEQNIQAADDRECLAGITGLDSYVFPTGSQLKATLVDANTVTIGTGAGSLQGSRFRCSTTTTVNIQSGTQGQFRHDIIGLRFSRKTSGREDLEFHVLTGAPAASKGAAADPAYTAGDLLKGGAEAFMPLYRVKLSGINAADPEPMFSVLTPLAALGDSVSQSGPTDLAEGVSYSIRSGICTVSIRKLTLTGPGAKMLGTLPVKPLIKNTFDVMAPIIMFQSESYPWSGTVGAMWVNVKGNVWAGAATSGTNSGWSGTLSFPIDGAS